MSTPVDPLEIPALAGPDRLHYVQGTLLDSDDFTDEQTYHRGRLARSLKYTFGPGTIAGLDIQWRADDLEIVITPGLAIDPLGRLIELTHAQCIHIPGWFRDQRDEDLRSGWLTEFGATVVIADVFVRFCVVEQGKTPKFAEGAVDATNAQAPSRLRDDFELGLVVREEAGARREALADPPPDPADIPVVPVPDADEILLGIPPGDLEPVRELILALWRDRQGDWPEGRPRRLREHLSPRVQLFEDDATQIGREPTSLMLARLAIPVTPPSTASGVPVYTGEAPMFDETATVAEYRRGKFVRRFVYALGHLTRPVAE